MAFDIHRQPLKCLYLIYKLCGTLCVRLPLWFIFAIPRSWRPRPSWSIKRVLLVQLSRRLVQVIERTGNLSAEPDHLAIEPGKNINGIWVDPIPDTLITGELKIWANVSSVTPVRLPAYWIHRDKTAIVVGSPPNPGEKVILALHGGSYTSGTAHPSYLTANIARSLVEHIPSVHRVLSLEYRLSTAKSLMETNPFPTALIDALAGYNYLVDTIGFAPANIIVEGDSSGGNLALALTRYLVEYHDTPDISDFPAPPGALLLLSPWCDVGTSHDVPRSTTILNADYDLEPNGVGGAKAAFVGPYGMGAAELNRYISPASLHSSMQVNFRGFPRTFISAGGAENLLPQIRMLKERMVRDLGEDDEGRGLEGMVRFSEAEDAPHDFVIFQWMNPQREETLKEIARWVDAM